MLKVNFDAYGSYVTDQLYQWDTNRILTITGLDLASVPEIHYSNVLMEKALSREGTIKGDVITAEIPNTLLQAPYPISAHIGVWEWGSFRTIETVIIPVIPRPRPTDYVFEDTAGEVYSYNALENAIANIVADASDMVGNTELADVRRGYDGTRYASAGVAVRTQIKKIADDIEALNEGGLALKDEVIGEYIAEWLDENPEATTTVQDGSLTEAKFSDELNIKKSNYYPSMGSLKADTALKSGMRISTGGYYTVNDGGGALYVIKEKNSGFTETFFDVSLNDELYAELVIENNTVNVRQLGATPENDLHDYLLEYVDKCQTETRFKLYIPNGKWLCTETEIFARKGFYIYGDKSFNMRGYSVEGTIITAKNDNQDYVLKVGNTDYSATYDQPTANFVLDDIVFSSAVYDESSVLSINHVNKAVLVISGATLGFINCLFQNIHGTALHINDSWELYFGKTNFRFIGDVSTPVLCFGESVGTTSSGSNISAIEFDTIMFESVAGDCILFENGCRFDGNKIGHINAKLAISDINMIGASIVETNPDDIGTNFMSLIKAHSAVGLIIGDINLQMLNRKVLTDGNGNTYVYKYIFDIPSGGLVQGSVGSVFANNLGKNAKLLRAVSPNYRTELHFLDTLFWEETLCQIEEDGLLDLTEYTTIKDMGPLHRKKESTYEMELHTGLPFYKIATVSIANKLSPLNSDETSITPLKIVCSLSENTATRVIGRIYNDKSKKMLVRVKAPVGSCTLQVLGKQDGYDWRKMITFDGTGDWQYVEVDTTECDDDTIVRFADPATNYDTYGENLKFDLIKFISVT